MLRNKISGRICQPISQTWIVFIPLTLVGGFLDSYSFICKGGVFANAITGDIAYMGIYLVQGSFWNVLLSGIAIFSYAMGVLTATFLSSKLKNTKWMYWRQWLLFFETAILVAVAFIHDHHYDIIANVLIAFMCAMQVQGFRKIHGVVAASTMCTGNMRSGCEQIYYFLTGKGKQHIKNAGVFFLVIAIFFVGVVGGAFLSHVFSDYASLFAAGVLFIASLLVLVENRNCLTDM